MEVFDWNLTSAAQFLGMFKVSSYPFAMPCPALTQAAPLHCGHAIALLVPRLW